MLLAAAAVALLGHHVPESRRKRKSIYMWIFMDSSQVTPNAEPNESILVSCGVWGCCQLLVSCLRLLRVSKSPAAYLLHACRCRSCSLCARVFMMHVCVCVRWLCIQFIVNPKRNVCVLKVLSCAHTHTRSMDLAAAKYPIE